MGCVWVCVGLSCVLSTRERGNYIGNISFVNVVALNRTVLFFSRYGGGYILDGLPDDFFCSVEVVLTLGFLIDLVLVDLTAFLAGLDSDFLASDLVDFGRVFLLSFLGVFLLGTGFLAFAALAFLAFSILAFLAFSILAFLAFSPALFLYLPFSICLSPSRCLHDLSP